jgi:uncharacterized protein (UPF0332 family)
MASASFDWANYLTLADALEKNQDEASLRSSISRAYYCVYHMALNRAVTNGFTLDRNQPTHVQVWSFFHGSTDRDCRQLAFYGNRMKRSRVKADYDDTFHRIHDDTNRTLSYARRFTEGLDKLDPAHPHP